MGCGASKEELQSADASENSIKLFELQLGWFRSFLPFE